MMSISGLASGLDTAGIIDQLMQLEAISQRRLEAKVKTQNDVITALRQVNTRSSTVGSAAENLAKAESWQTLKGTSTSPLVTVTTTDSAIATSFDVTVEQVAVAHQRTYTDAVALTQDIVANADNKLTLTIGGTAHEIVTDGTLQGVVTAINEADLGVTAAPVRVADGSYRLQVTAEEVGTGSVFTLTDADGADLVLGGFTERQGVGARINVDGIVAQSADNTFTDLVPGVTVTISGSAIGSAAATAENPATKASITVAQDSAGVASSVKGLVDKVNELLTYLDTATNAGATGTRGALAGDSASRSLRSALVNTVFGGDNTSLAPVGIETDKYGKLVFDEAKFKEAYAADPAGVAARFTASEVEGEEGGWAARVAAVTEAAYGDKGTITAAIAGRESTIERLEDSIAEWDVRLEMRRTTLTRQFTALEVALSNMNGQASWLAGQISSLPSYNNS